MIPKFDPKELKITGEAPATHLMPNIALYDYPVTQREAFKGMFQRKAVWQISNSDCRLFLPAIVPDNIARASVNEALPFDNNKDGGGLDMFGLDWEYVPQVGGSMVRPGKPFMEDANEWREKLVWPDIDSWDWEGAAKRNNDTYLKCNEAVAVWLFTGWYERLMSFMDFEGAVMAMIDEDQTDAVKELFDRLSELYIRIFEKYITHFPNIDTFVVHDDWGGQKETFFSPAVAAEMIVPYMKKVTDFLHSKGKICEFHSCGQLFKQIPNMIEAGWDAWVGQLVNDTQKIYDLYGDKIIIGVAPEMFDPKTTPESEQRAAAKAYADKFCNPDKPCYLNRYAASLLHPAFREELYIRSRENYSR